MLLIRESESRAWILLGVLVSVLLGACASVSDLPRRASEVDFVDHISGTPSIREYDSCVNYIGVDIEAMVEAAKFSLVKNKFNVKISSPENNVVRGEHGVSARDWNIVAGIYFKKTDRGVAVKTIVRTATSTSLYQDKRGSAKEWVDKIAVSIGTYLQRNLGSSSSVMKCG